MKKEPSIHSKRPVSIVWLEPIEGLDYVREAYRPYYNFRRKEEGVRLVGYDSTPGQFRRVYLLRSYDRDSDPTGIYAVQCPAEAVDPRTVVVGKPGQRTARCFGGALREKIAQDYSRRLSYPIGASDSEKSPRAIFLKEKE